MQDRFKRLLEEKNLTATRFAALINVNASAMSHILNGRSKPGFDVLDKIAQAFPDVNMNWLITGKGTPYMSKTANVPVHNPPLAGEPSLFPDKESSPKSTVRKPELPPVIPTEVLSDKLQKHTDKRIKRVIIFYEDGTFESYEQ